MTDPTGRSFLSYRRVRREEAELLVRAQHDHGIPTWQDIHDLGSVPTEDELRRVLADPVTANAILFITPEIGESPIIRNVEVPKILRRASAGDAFFAVPIAAGGLDYEGAAAAAGNHVSAQDLTVWNMERLTEPSVTAETAAALADRILRQRIRAIHHHLPPGEPMRLGFFVRRAAPFELGTALAIDWSERFQGKEASAEEWSTTLLPAMRRVANAIRQHSPGRPVCAFGLPTLPAAIALGCAFIATGGTRLEWLQRTPRGVEELWGLHIERRNAQFKTRMISSLPSARDVALLVSVSDDVEPLFAECCKGLAPLRAIVQVSPPGNFPYSIPEAGHAADIAETVQRALREARREYGAIGTVHLFAAVPAGLAVMIGQQLNTFGHVQTYEHVPIDGSGCYREGPLLLPCS
jgi:hypothetical protein